MLHNFAMIFVLPPFYSSLPKPRYRRNVKGTCGATVSSPLQKKLRDRRNKTIIVSGRLWPIRHSVLVADETTDRGPEVGTNRPALRVKSKFQQSRATIFPPSRDRTRSLKELRLSRVSGS